MDIMRKLAVEGTVKWMDNAIELHEKAAQELRQHRERFLKVVADEAEHGVGSTTPVNVLSWFVNSASTYMALNIRYDMVANHAAALALTQEKK